MLLVCPNCDKKYKMTAEQLGDVGRNVECSNCHHVWFSTAKDLVSPQDLTPRQPLNQPAPQPAMGTEKATNPNINQEQTPETQSATPNSETSSTNPPMPIPEPIMKNDPVGKPLQSSSSMQKISPIMPTLPSQSKRSVTPIMPKAPNQPLFSHQK